MRGPKKVEETTYIKSYVGPDLPMGRSNFEERRADYGKVYGHSAVSCAKTAVPTEMPFGLYGLWVQGSMCYIGCTLAPPGEYH